MHLIIHVYNTSDAVYTVIIEFETLTLTLTFETLTFETSDRLFRIDETPFDQVNIVQSSFKILAQSSDCIRFETQICCVQKDKLAIIIIYSNCHISILYISLKLS